MLFPAAVPSAKGRARYEREPTGENANFSDNSDNSDDSDSAQTMERDEDRGNGFPHRSNGRSVFSPAPSEASEASEVSEVSEASENHFLFFSARSRSQ